MGGREGGREGGKEGGREVRGEVGGGNQGDGKLYARKTSFLPL